MSELKECPFCGGEARLVNCGSPMVVCLHGCCQIVNDNNSVERWSTRPIEDGLRAEIARRDEELLELNDKAVFIKFENEDELPAEIKDDVYSAMFECSHVDGVRLFPYIEENGQKYFLVMLEVNGLEACCDCVYAHEHMNIKGSPCYDCKRRNKFIKSVEQGSTEPDFDKMPIKKINQYLLEHGYDPEKVGLRGKILVEALTKNIIAREIIQRLLADPGGCRFCDFGVLRKPDNPLKGHDENCPYLAAHAYLDNETSTVVKRDLSDAEINELGAREAEKRDKK